MELPVGFLDNDFRDPDVERYLEEFERVDPSVAVVGDAYTRSEARQYQSVVDELEESFPEKTYVVSPKCEAAFEVLDDDTVLGVPQGYSSEDPLDVAELEKWRGRKLHILGGSPPKQYSAIQKFTQPTLNGLPESDVVGVDWNGPHKVAYKGEYWSRNGWKAADHLSIRETVYQSLQEIKGYWQGKELWPETELVDLSGEAVQVPDDRVFHGSGRNVGSEEELWDACIVENDDRVYGYESETRKDFVTYREGIPTSD